MYSMVLMMALSTGANTPATFFHRGHGCNGCYGGGCNGCYGGCYGGGCGGCYGGCSGRGWGHGGFLFGRGHGCHGCYGGCYGTSYGCHGCYGCYGGCYGGQVQQLNPQPLPPAGGPGTKPPAGGATPPPVGKEEVFAPTSARLLVSVPSNAKLFIDDVATKSTSSSRLFVTPTLTPGTDYVYTLKAEITREGKTETITKQVTVRAGQTTETSIDLPVATASK